jgi:hypothetical protein
MRNRAKCKLCEQIIESLHSHDYVPCKCGEIAIDGGDSYFRCVAHNWANFLRIDDDGNVIVPEIKDSPELEAKGLPEGNEAITESRAKVGRAELLDMLDEMVKNIDNLPRHAMDAPVTHSDLSSVLLLISKVLRDS